jgi:hypothetical protein
MHTLQATRDVRKVSLWLGHASLQSRRSNCGPTRCDSAPDAEARTLPRPRQSSRHAEHDRTQVQLCGVTLPKRPRQATTCRRRGATAGRGAEPAAAFCANVNTSPSSKPLTNPERCRPVRTPEAFTWKPKSSAPALTATHPAESLSRFEPSASASNKTATAIDDRVHERAAMRPLERVAMRVIMALPALFTTTPCLLSDDRMTAVCHGQGREL